MPRPRMTAWYGPGAASICAALALAVPRTWGAQDNLLDNGGFERLDPVTACPQGWRPWAQPTAAVYSLAASRGGLACAALTDASPTASQGLRSPSVRAEPGKTYEASVWVYIERLEAGGFSLYLEYWTGEARVADFATSTEAVGRWIELRLARPAPPGATAVTVLVYGSSATVGRALFDEAALRPR